MPTDRIESVISWLYRHDRGLDGPVTLTLAAGEDTVSLAGTPEISEALADVLRLVQADAGVIVLPSGRDLTTGQAAAVLGVSRSRLLDLLDAGDLPCYRVGSHRRVRLVDLLDHRRRVERAGDEAATAARLARGRRLRPSRP